MYTPTFARASTAYRRVGVETSVQNANPHQLVHLLFEEFFQCLSKAQGALERKDIPAKGHAIGRAVRILEEGLKAGLNPVDGGELASNLGRIYDYCVMQLTLANVRNDVGLIQEVRKIIDPIASAWSEINPANSGINLQMGA